MVNPDLVSYYCSGNSICSPTMPCLIPEPELSDKNTSADILCTAETREDVNKINQSIEP